MNEYSLLHFASMILDKTRMGSYAEAMRQVIKPGDVVADIGAGTGIFALIACQLGASKVYAIETNQWLDIGKEMAAANGYADRIVFIREMSTDVTLPEQVDVIVADTRGRLPLYEANILSMYDAKTRLLKPGGTLIPLRDHINVTFAENEDVYQKIVYLPWGENDYGLDMSSALRFQTNRPLGETIRPQDIILPAQHWVTLEYGVTSQINYKGEFQWVVESPRTAHFICLWFEAYLCENIHFDNAPGEDGAQVYGTMLLPLTNPVNLEPGDIIQLKLRGDKMGEAYAYSWLTLIKNAQGDTKADFRQNSLFSAPITGMSKRAPTHTPQRNEKGDVTAFILAAMDGQQSSEQIAKAVQAQFPQRFSTFEAALEQVTLLAQSFGS